LNVTSLFCVENCAAAPNLIESIDSLIEPPAATVTVVIVIFVNPLIVEFGTKAAALLAASPFVIDMILKL
jgi:hypothetical protein